MDSSLEAWLVTELSLINNTGLTSVDFLGKPRDDMDDLASETCSGKLSMESLDMEVEGAFLALETRFNSVGSFIVSKIAINVVIQIILKMISLASL
jgi:hypothetical protein